jgi:transcriptional regulator
VPTWNYIAVHVRGQARLIEDEAGLLQLVSRLSAAHEAGRERPWAVSDAPRDYIDSMLRAIVGFALPIQRIQGQWKLSQNRTVADRDGVRAGLNTSLSPADHALAARLTP